MAVKVMIRRKKVAENNSEALADLLKQLRKLVIDQPGYISGETWKRVDEPGENVVIATWHNVDDYMKWVFSKERAEIQDRIDELIGFPTEYAVYQYM